MRHFCGPCRRGSWISITVSGERLDSPPKWLKIAPFHHDLLVVLNVQSQLHFWNATEGTPNHPTLQWRVHSFNPNVDIPKYTNKHPTTYDSFSKIIWVLFRSFFLLKFESFPEKMVGFTNFTFISFFECHAAGVSGSPLLWLQDIPAAVHEPCDAKGPRNKL